MKGPDREPGGIWRHRWALAVSAALLPIYLLTLAPTITWAHHGADGGDLVTAVVRGSIPHPPGFPTYLLLGELFIRLPWGEPAWRLNLMSAVLAVGAGALTTVAVSILLRRLIVDGRAYSVGPVALTTGLSLGLAPLLWSQALVAETYAPAAFFAALVVILALLGGPAWLLGLAWGMGMGAHPTLLFLAPLVAWGTGRCDLHSLSNAGVLGRSDCQSDLRGNGQREYLGRLVQAALIAFLGWGTMYGPLLLARRGAPSPWGDVSTFAGWWALVSGRMYRGYLFALPLADWPRRLLAGAGFLARQFTPLGAALAAVGWMHLCGARRLLALVTMLAFGAFSLYAVGYDTADSLVYLVPALPLAALWLGVGLARAAGWLGHRLRRGKWMLLLLPLLQALVFWKAMDLSGDREAVTWAERILEEAPPQAVLLTAQDAHTFTLWYVHDALGGRPDVVVVDRDLWGQESYCEMMGQVFGLETAADDLSPEEAARRAGRPVIEVVGGE